MKVIILFFCLTTSIKFFGQKVTYNDLIGTSWTYTKMPKSDSISFVFIDSAHYKFYYWKDGKNLYDGTLMNYSLDTSYTPTLWHFGNYIREDDGKKIEVSGVYCFLKFINKNILEAHSTSEGTKPRKKVAKKYGGHIYTLTKTN
jgi:hypothetical protein